jgi:chaperonin GroEL
VRQFHNRFLAKQSKVVGTDSDKIKQIASISANNDEVIGDLLLFAKSRKRGCHQLKKLKEQKRMLMLRNAV